MHSFVHSVMRTVFFGVALAFAASAATADENRSPTVFTEPPLGLGADVPDDLLFGNSSAGAPRSRSRVTVRSRTHSGGSTAESEPILDGWEIDNIEVTGENSWMTAEPVRPGCLDPHAIMSSLSEAGWSEFTRRSLRPRTLAFNARRRDGLVKRIQIDRCTGEIIHVSASYTN